MVMWGFPWPREEWEGNMADIVLRDELAKSSWIHTCQLSRIIRESPVRILRVVQVLLSLFSDNTEANSANWLLVLFCCNPRHCTVKLHQKYAFPKIVFVDMEIWVVPLHESICKIEQVDVDTKEW